MAKMIERLDHEGHTASPVMDLEPDLGIGLAEDTTAIALARQIARHRRNAALHARRVELSVEHHDRPGAYGALVDVFIAFGQDLQSFRQHLLASARPLLTAEQASLFDTHLALGLRARDPIPAAPASLLTSGVTGVGDLVMIERVHESVPTTTTTTTAQADADAEVDAPFPPSSATGEDAPVPAAVEVHSAAEHSTARPSVPGSGATAAGPAAGDGHHRDGSGPGVRGRDAGEASGGRSRYLAAAAAGAVVLLGVGAGLVARAGNGADGSATPVTTAASHDIVPSNIAPATLPPLGAGPASIEPSTIVPTTAAPAPAAVSTLAPATLSPQGPGAPDPAATRAVQALLDSWALPGTPGPEFAEGSRAGVATRTVGAWLEQSGRSVRIDGLTLSSRTASAEAARATVAVELGWTEYAVVDRNGTVISRPFDPAHHLTARVQLVDAGGHWVVSDLSLSA